MKKVALGETGEYLSQIGLGCMLMGTKVDQESSYRMLDRYVDAGGNLLDTANCYAWWMGNGEYVGDESETVLGDWMQQKKNRDSVFIATKVGARLRNPKGFRNERGDISWDRVPGEFERLAPDVVRRGVEDSLKRLRTDYIDLYYVHIDDRTTLLEDTLGVLDDLVKAGKVRHIGCSNYRTWRLERSRGISSSKGWASFSAIQQQYTYIRPNPGADFGVSVHADDELMDFLTENPDVTLMAYSPLLKGIYDDEAKREAFYNWHLFNNGDTHSRLQRLSEKAKELNVRNSQLVLAWLLHHRPKVLPILGVSSMEQLEQNMKAVDINLNEGDIACLNA